MLELVTSEFGLIKRHSVPIRKSIVFPCMHNEQLKIKIKKITFIVAAKA